jgi:hypothetical protein
MTENLKVKLYGIRGSKIKDENSGIDEWKPKVDAFPDPIGRTGK